MRELDAGDFLNQFTELISDREWLHRREALGAGALDKKEWARLKNNFAAAEAFAQEHEFHAAWALLNALNGRLDDDPPDSAAIQTDLQHVFDMLYGDACRASFLRVPPHLKKYVDHNAIFGVEVFAAFPSARHDLTAAGNCLAADCSTAAVFHLMRAVEWGLRALAVHLGFRQLKVRKQSGIKKIVPLSHLEWEKVLDQLQVKVDRKVERMRPGKQKQDVQQFYYLILQDIRGMRDAWRNHVMHARSEYTAADALAIFERVERLMIRLAIRVSENGPSRRATSSRVRRFLTSE